MENSIMERYGPDLIKDIKAVFGLSQTDLAKVLGITQQAVSTYELGLVKKERYDVIQKMKDILEWKFDPVLEEILEKRGMGHLVRQARAKLATAELEAKKYVQRQALQIVSGSDRGGARNRQTAGVSHFPPGRRFRKK